MSTRKKSKNISGACPGKALRFAIAGLAASFLILLAWDCEAETHGVSYEAGMKYLEAWDVERASAVAEALMKKDPSQPQHRYLMANALFYKGSYSAARDTLSPAMEQAQKGPQVAYLMEMIERTTKATKSLTTFHEGGLVISLDAEKDSILIPYIKEAMGRALEAVQKRLGYRPDRPLRIEVYPDSESFHLASSLTRRDIEVSGAVGIAKFNKIMLISPRALARGYPWLDTLAHEYMHYVIVMLSANQAPVWFHEGTAKFYESAWRSDVRPALDPVSRTLLARALDGSSLISFEEMYPSLVKLETAEKVQLAYAEAETAIALIASLAGDEGIKKTMQGMALEPQLDPIRIIESSLTWKQGEFTARWMEYLESLQLKPLEGLEVLHHTVKGALDSSDALDLKEIKSEASRNHMRLGDMLKNQGRLSAAALEYKRALSSSPYSPVILNRLGGALTKTGATAEALEKLKLAEELYPAFGLTYKNMAEIFRQQNKPALAQDYFVKAIRINPFDPSLHAGLRDVLLAQNRTREAEEEEAILKKLLSKTVDKSGQRTPRTGDTDE